jgi:Na+/H+ antiporter NhaD/arsenite permease-like protein
VAALLLTIQYAVLSFGFRSVLAAAVIHPPDTAPRSLDRRLLGICLGTLVLVFAGFVAGLNLAWTALAGGALVMVLARRDTHEVLKLVDWHLLVFFAALFVVVEGLNGTGLPDQVYGHLRGLFGGSANHQAWNLAWFSVAGSNIFSNVPFVLVAGKWINNLADPVLMWKVMALATTLAGNLTILGSVANIIVVESARKHVEVGFWDYAKYGIPVTILTTLAGMVLLLWLR